MAIAESWAENYGAGGVRDGANIPFHVPASCAEVTFVYDAVSRQLSVGAQGAPRGDLKKAKAHWLTRDTIAWNVNAGRQPPLSPEPLTSAGAARIVGVWRRR